MGNLIVVGIDPGLTIGVATVQVADGEISKDVMRQVSYLNQEFYNFLDVVESLIREDRKIIFVVEDFELLESKATQVSRRRESRRLEVVRVIGAIEYFCHTHGLTLVMQSATLNPMNAKHSGRPIPKNHANSHQVIAYNHAYHYLLKNNLIRHRILDRS